MSSSLKSAIKSATEGDDEDPGKKNHHGAYRPQVLLAQRVLPGSVRCPYSLELWIVIIVDSQLFPTESGKCAVKEAN